MCFKFIKKFDFESKICCKHLNLLELHKKLIAPNPVLAIHNDQEESILINLLSAEDIDH